MGEDRFAFEDRFGTEEPAEESGGPNRLFIIIAIALIGLIMLGALGIGGYMVIIRPGQQTSVAAQNTKVVAEATAAAYDTALAPTDTPVPTDTPAPTPTPRATNTPVIRPTDTLEPGAVPTPTRTPVGGGQTPQTGFGGLAAVLAAAALAVVIFAARKLRLAR